MTDFKYLLDGAPGGEMQRLFKEILDLSRTRVGTVDGFTHAHALGALCRALGGVISDCVIKEGCSAHDLVKYVGSDVLKSLNTIIQIQKESGRRTH